MASGWPALPYEAWKATRDTLHAHTQVLGKLSTALAPPEPQLQHTALRLTVRGWETRPLPAPDDSGALAGLHLGYNWQSGARVLGVEGDADWADNRDYLASVRLRLGHAFDQVLIYGTAGVAFGRSSDGVTSVSLTSGGAGGQGENGRFENNTDAYAGAGGRGGTGGQGGVASVTKTDGDDKVGFVVGGGFEVKLSERTSIGVEGLYYGFDGNGAASSSTSYDSSDDLSAAVVRGRVTYHLDGDPEQESLK